MVNGLKHGYGVEHFGAFNSNFYEGEFQNGLPHGYGKWRVPLGSDEFLEHEGWWEYGTRLPAKRLTEESRQARLQTWS